MKRTYRISVIVKNCDIIFKEGLEPGVLGFEDSDYDLDENEYASPKFVAHLIDREKKWLSELLKTEVQMKND